MVQYRVVRQLVVCDAPVDPGSTENRKFTIIDIPKEAEHIDISPMPLRAGDDPDSNVSMVQITWIEKIKGK